MFPTKFQFIYESGFRGEDFLEISNLDVGMQTFLRRLIYVRWAIQAHLSL
jgi:hypothetical protein